MTNPTSREGRAVATSFRLPWNTTRSMADVWGLDAHERRIERLSHWRSGGRPTGLTKHASAGRKG